MQHQELYDLLRQNGLSEEEAMNAVLYYVSDCCFHEQEVEFSKDENPLSSMFPWNWTPEGANFWGHLSLAVTKSLELVRTRKGRVKRQKAKQPTGLGGLVRAQQAAKEAEHEAWALLVSKLIENGLDEDTAITAVCYAQAEALYRSVTLEARTRTPEDHLASEKPLAGMFVWDDTPEGFHFWANLNALEPQ